LPQQGTHHAVDGRVGALFLLLYSGAKISSFNCLNMMW
jgi:hypothetical protein